MTAIAEIVPSAGDYIERLTEHWHRWTATTFDIGNLLIEAKAALPHGEFERMILTQLPFSPRRAQEFMQIARNQGLVKWRTSALLPTEPDALVHLSRLAIASERKFDALCLDGTIHPNLTIAQCKALARPDPEPLHVAARDPDSLTAPIRGHTDWIAAIKGYRLALGLTQADLEGRTGLQSGYVAKLELQIRGMVHDSTWEWLAGADLALFVGSPDAKLVMP